MKLQIAILLGIISLASYCVTASAVTFEEDEYTLLELEYQRQHIGNGVESYLHNGSLYVLLLDIVSALEVNINVEEFRAEGHISNQSDKFDLTLKNDTWQVTSNNTTNMVSNEDIVIYNNYIYVKEAQIEKWFGLRFQLAYSELKLSFTATKSLPVLERLNRQNRKIGKRGVIEPYKNPVKDTPYELFELPSIDLRSTTYFRDSQNTEATSNSFYTLITHGDLGYMNTRLFFNGSPEDDIRNASVRMDRYDSTGKMGGALGLSQISLGDMTFPTVAFAPGSSGRGVMIGNESSSRQNTQDTTSIEGDYYPGQEVELYFNDSLIGYQIIPENGHYVFEDVVLFPGDNAFLLKFYDLNGEVTTENRNIHVGSNAGENNVPKYSLSLSQPNKTTIDIDERNRGFDDEVHAAFRTRYSFNNYFSGHLGFVHFETETESDDYFNAGLQAYLFGSTLSVDASTHGDELIGIIYGLGGRLFGARYNFSTTIYEDPDLEPSDPLFVSNRQTQSYDLSINALLNKKGFTLKSRRDEFDFGYNESHRLNLSGELWDTNISNTLSYQVENDGFGIHDEEMNGGLFLSRSIYPVSARLNLAYDVIPENELTTAALSFSYSPSSKITTNFGVTHNILNDTTDYELSGSWKLKYLQITPRIRHDGFNNTSAVLNIFTALGKRTGRFGNYYNLDPKKSSSRGSLRARLFEDNNMNGVYDEGEDLLKGGKVVTPQYNSKATSNNGGVAWIEHTRPWEPTDVNYVENSIDAFSMQYSGDPVAVAIRPGKVTELDMPFTRTGDIDGIVFRQGSDGVQDPIRGAVVVAIDKTGNSVAENRTDLDGYFSFESLMPNSYTLTVKHENVIERSKTQVTITNQGEYISDYRLVIAPKGSNGAISNKSLKKPNAIKLNNTKKQIPVKKSAPAPSNKTKTFPLPKLAPVKPIEVPSTLKAKPITILPKPDTNKTKNIIQDEPTDVAKFAIKIGSFSKRSYAIEAIKKMKALGYTPYTEVANSSKGIVTRVFVGPITGESQANTIKTQLNNQYGERSFVIPYKP